MRTVGVGLFPSISERREQRLQPFKPFWIAPYLGGEQLSPDDIVKTFHTCGRLATVVLIDTSL